MSLADVGGFDVRRASGGAEALSMIDDFAPHFIILDFRMPGMNGDELLTNLRASRLESRDVPAAFMTASLMPGHVKRLKELGALDVISKPFDPITLPDRVRSIWDEATRSA